MNATVFASLLIFGSLVCDAIGQDLPKTTNWKLYDYIVEMPGFMEDCPSMGSDVGGIFWEWSSKDGDVRVAHSFITQPGKILKTAGSLNRLVENLELDALLDFFKTGRDKYFYQIRNADSWEMAFAEKLPDGSCRIALYWVQGNHAGKVQQMLRALRKGHFGRRSAAFDAIIIEVVKRHNEIEMGRGGRLVVELNNNGEIFFEGKAVNKSNLKLLFLY
ncbi:MAG: hypothetical protein QM496_07995 [Verrucomicrobiota bacterium]